VVESDVSRGLETKGGSGCRVKVFGHRVGAERRGMLLYSSSTQALFSVSSDRRFFLQVWLLSYSSDGFLYLLRPLPLHSSAGRRSGQQMMGPCLRRQASPSPVLAILTLPLGLPQVCPTLTHPTRASLCAALAPGTEPPEL